MIGVSLVVGMMMTVFYDIFLVLTASWFNPLDEPHKTITHTITSGLFAILLGIPLLVYFTRALKKTNDDKKPNT